MRTLQPFKRTPQGPVAVLGLAASQRGHTSLYWCISTDIDAWCGEAMLHKDGNELLEDAECYLGELRIEWLVDGRGLDDVPGVHRGF